MHKSIEMPSSEIMANFVERAYEYDFGKLPFHADADAPNTFKKLQEWGASGEQSIPVYSGGCEYTIYSTDEANHLFRAWHDRLHLRHNLGFKKADEIKVSELHCSTLRAVGAPYNVVKAMEADVEGQVRYYDETQEYVVNQLEFVADCLKYGISTVLYFVSKGVRY